jgi:hypothetical protein
VVPPDPGPRSLAHIRARRYVVAAVDGAARYRAMAVFERSSPYGHLLA